MLLSAIRRRGGGVGLGRAWSLRDRRSLPLSGLRVAFSSWSRAHFPAASARRTTCSRLRELRALGPYVLPLVSGGYALQWFVQLTGCHGLELSLFAPPSPHLADLAVDHYLSAVWAPHRRDDADERLPFFLRLPFLPRPPETCARRLLCVLQLWLHSVSTHSDWCTMLCLNSTMTSNHAMESTADRHYTRISQPHERHL